MQWKLATWKSCHEKAAIKGVTKKYYWNLLLKAVLKTDFNWVVKLLIPSNL